MTIDCLKERLTIIKDSIDTDFLNRQEIEGVTTDITNLINDIEKTNGIVDIDRDVSAEFQIWKNNRDQFNSECD
tara:strand:- start:240 stop:461 length:222 start_codon:yes stop_codon:yes gene_type:complete